MNPRLLAVPALLFLLVAGVAGAMLPAASLQAVEPSPVGQYASPIPDSGFENEPSIDITPDGRVFVTAISGIPSRSPIYELLSSGTWFDRGAQLTRNGEIGGGDADIEFDSLGRGYHTDLWLGNDGMAVSKDTRTWIGAPLGHYMSVNDRQWFAHDGSQYLYMITNNQGVGAVSFRYEIGTPAGELGAFMAPVETPLLCICGPPGFPAVDQRAGFGTVFVPMGSNGVTVFRSLNHGVNWGAITIPGSGDPILFPVAATDSAGNAYVVWTEEKDGQRDVFLSVSKNKGLTWRAPVKVSNGGTNLMPWVVAGASGKVGVAWYSTSTVGDSNSVSTFQNAEWRVSYAQSLDALAAAPTFTKWDVTGPVHKGTVSTNGLLGSADRSLGDFMSIALHPQTGKVWIAYVNNHPSTPSNQHGVWVATNPAAAASLL